VRKLGDAKSSLGDAKSSLGDATSSLGDAKSSLGDAKSSLGNVVQHARESALSASVGNVAPATPLTVGEITLELETHTPSATTPLVSESHRSRVSDQSCFSTADGIPKHG
jgi:hypothetical protein